MYVCICHAITEKEVVAQVKAGSTTYSQIQFELGVGTCCGQCADHARTVIDQACADCTGCAGNAACAHLPAAAAMVATEQHRQPTI